MTAVSLKELLPDALEKGYAIPGFVVLGWEDAISFVEASEELNLPIIIQAGPACRQHTPIPVLGKMFRELADKAKTKMAAQQVAVSIFRLCWMVRRVRSVRVFFPAPFQG